MATLIWPDGEGENARHPEGLQCDCGRFLDWAGFGRDYSCDRCGREYNSGGQDLAPRSQWGEETGEHPADIDRAFNSPDNDGDKLNDRAWDFIAPDKPGPRPCCPFCYSRDFSARYSDHPEDGYRCRDCGCMFDRPIFRGCYAD